MEARPGRTFDIGGDLDVDLGRVTRIRAADLTLGNDAWSKRDTMASTDLLEFTVDIPALLTGYLRLPELRLTAPEVWLETGDDPGGNWTFGDGDGPGPDLGGIWIDDGRLSSADVRVAAETRRLALPATACGKASRSTSRASPSRRWSCATASARIGSTCTHRPAPPGRMRAARWSTRSASATSTCSFNWPVAISPTCTR